MNRSVKIGRRNPMSRPSRRNQRKCLCVRRNLLSRASQFRQRNLLVWTSTRGGRSVLTKRSKPVQARSRRSVPTKRRQAVVDEVPVTSGDDAAQLAPEYREQDEDVSREPAKEPGVASDADLQPLLLQMVCRRRSARSLLVCPFPRGPRQPACVSIVAHRSGTGRFLGAWGRFGVSGRSVGHHHEPTAVARRGAVPTTQRGGVALSGAHRACLQHGDLVGEQSAVPWIARDRAKVCVVSPALVENCGQRTLAADRPGSGEIVT